MFVIKMSEEMIPSLSPHRGESWSDWLYGIENYGDPLLSQTMAREVHSSVSLLPRKDILLFGTCPKMDVRVICQCEKCSKVMMPSAFVSHNRERHGPDQVHSIPVVPPGTSLLKRSKKKSSLPPPPLFPKQNTPPNSPITANTAPVDLSPPILQPVQAAKPFATPPASPTQSPANAGSNSGGQGGGNGQGGSRHKKSKRSYKKIKEYDPDKHCGVVEGHKDPCLRSITCSNHAVHLRKAVQGRSKEFQQLIAEHKAAKEKEQSKMNQAPPTTSAAVVCTTSIPTSVAVQVSVPIQEPTSPILPPPPPLLLEPAPSMPILDTTDSFPSFMDVSTPFLDFGTVSQTFTSELPTSISKCTDSPMLTEPLHVKVDSPLLDLNSQGSLDTPSSLMYMPVSPLTVVSPIQFVQFGGPILRVASTQPVLSPPLATQPVVVTIPVQTNSATMYTTHPKPLIMSTCSTRKVGGTFVLQNQRIDHQRREIQKKIKKANILSNSTRGGNHRVSSTKRQAADRGANDSKHIRLNDVNGFIIHADVNETPTDSPQTNNSIHENIAIINMKQ